MNIGALIGADFNVPLWLILILILSFIYYKYMTWHYGELEKMGIRAPKPTFMMGTFGKMMKEGIIAHDKSIIEEYGTIAGCYAGRKPSILTTDLDIAKEIFVKQSNSFIRRQANITDPREPTNLMLSMAEDERWRNQRSAISPTFSAGKLKLMSKAINWNAEKLIEHLERKMEAEKMFDFKEHSAAFTMDTIASTGFGIQLDSQQDQENEFLKNAKAAVNFSFKNPVFFVFFVLPWAVKHVYKLGLTFMPMAPVRFFSGVTDKALEQREKSEKASDFLQIMANAIVEKPLTRADVDNTEVFEDRFGLWKKGAMTRDEILANAFLFFLAGYETTSNTLTFVAYCIATNPDVQNKLIEEIDTQLEGKAPTYEDMSKMPYLDNVISETLRIYPQAQRVPRLASEDVELKGIKIPKDMEVGVCVQLIHMDPAYWPEPEKFDPDRFLPEAKENRNPYCYLPFGTGPRNCIGMRLALLEMKICIIRILQKYKIVPCEQTLIPMKLEKVQAKPEGGKLWLALEKREDISNEA